MHKHLSVIVLGLIVLLSLSSLADVDTDEGPCPDVVDCEFDLGEEYYCNPDTETCFLSEEGEENVPAAVTPAATATLATSAAAPAPDTPITTLETRIGSAQSNIIILQRDVGVVLTRVNSMESRVNQLDRKVDGLSGSTDALTEALDSQTEQTGAVTTGLASVQAGLGQTLEGVRVIEQELESEQKFTNLLKYTFFTLLVLAIAFGAIYYINRRSPRRVARPDVVSYITKHIREGKKFPFIKESLKRAGWSEQEVVLAYKETLRRNYQQYMQQKMVSAQPGAAEAAAAAARPSRAAAGPGAAALRSYDRNKMISIAVVSVLLLVGIFFLLSGTVGKAVFPALYLNLSSRELLYTITCTLPDIPTPDGDNCCRDADADAICDYAERTPEELAAGGRCTDNVQCGFNLPSLPPRVCTVPENGASLDACQGLGQGEKYTVTLTEPGTYTYRDKLYPEHTGTIIVEGENNAEEAEDNAEMGEQ